MARHPRPCSTCGRPSMTNRCPACTRRTHRTTTERGLGHDWRLASKAAITEWVATNGWVCPGWRRTAHSVRPGGLTGDHLVPRSQAGPAVPTSVGVLCGPCNSAKGAALAQ